MNDAATGQELATLADLGDLEEGRNRAIAHWLAAYDAFHVAAEGAGAASIAGPLSFHIPDGARYNPEEAELAKHFHAAGELDEWQGHDRIKISARDRFERTVTRLIDRKCWENLLLQLGFDALLDRQARDEFRKSLNEDPPAFTRANCQATFGTIWENRRDMYLRGIANVFTAMDRRFRSHDAFAIGNRLIIENAVSEWGGWNNYNRRDTLNDVERIFHELDGKAAPGWDTGICQQVIDEKRRQTTPFVIDGDYFRVRVFGNGNLHLWFVRKDLLEQINAMLLEYYKPIEGDVSEDGPSYESGPVAHATPARYFGAFNASEAVAGILMQKADIYGEGVRVLEPSAGSGVLARAARDKGAAVTCVEIQPGLAHELAAVHGFKTLEADFLKLDPADFEPFDKIVMNPPFDRGRDCDHVCHAFKFLRPGGTLVAIMSARAEHATDARHKPLHDLVKLCWGSRDRWAWHDLPERAFAHAGTNVNTVILKLEKPRGARS